MNIEIQNRLQFFYKNLDNISKISEGCKLYTDTHNIINIDEPYMLQGIYRFYFNFSRKKTLNVLNTLLHEIDIYFNSMYIKHTEYKQIKCKIKQFKLTNTNHNLMYIAFTTIISKINTAIIGIEKLQTTYKHDLETYNELHNIILKSKSLIEIFTNMIN